VSSLKKTAVSSLSWVFLQKFATQSINFVVSVLLARVLLPQEYGLIGMITIFIAIGNILTDAGFTSSLIRTPNPDHLDYSTVFTTNLLGSIIIYWIIFICAPFIADFYNQPILTSLVRVLSLQILIASFSSIQNTMLIKAMAFKKLMIMQIPSTIISGIVGLLMAYNGFGVWSLVLMQIAASLALTILLWKESDHKPSIQFSKQKFKQHFKYGVNLSLSGILEAVYENIYNIVIGKFFAPALVGYYTRAQTLRQLPVENISSTLHQITFPLFASIQNDNERLRLAYEKLMRQVTFWLAPVLTGMTVLAEPLFRFLFTAKWLPAVPYFQIIGLTGVLYSLSSFNLNILNIKGKSGLFFRLEVIKKVIITVGVIIAIPFGIYGLLIFRALNSVLSYFINGYYSGRLISFSVKEQIYSIVKPLTYALLMGALMWFIDKSLNNQKDIVRLLIGGVSGAIFYFVINYMTRETAAIDFYETFIRKKLAQR
jgi:O-antigen/teichoic acid export membrane protein